MPNLAPSNAGHAAHFTDGEWREVVMQHETLSGFAFKHLNPLHVVGCAQGGSDQRLSLATGEDGGAVSARQNANFNPDRTNFIKGARIGTAALMRDLVAEDTLPQSFIIMRKLSGRFVIIF